MAIDCIFPERSGNSGGLDRDRGVGEAGDVYRVSGGDEAAGLEQVAGAVNGQHGYRVHMNIMRYDVPTASQPSALIEALAKERPALFSLADRFQDAHFLPQPGVGVGGRPTVNYISAFLCAEDDD